MTRDTLPGQHAASAAPRRPHDVLIRVLTALLAHGLAVALFYLAHLFGVPIYRQLFGSISRGIALGLGSYYLFILFILVNGVAALVPNLKLKLGLVLLPVLASAWMFFPNNPIRGLVYCGLTGILPLLAIGLAQRLHRLFSSKEVTHG